MSGRVCRESLYESPAEVLATGLMLLKLQPLCSRVLGREAYSCLIRQPAGAYVGFNCYSIEQGPIGYGYAESLGSVPGARPWQMPFIDQPLASSH